MSTETTNKKIKIDNGTTFGKTYTDKAIDERLQGLVSTATFTPVKEKANNSLQKPAGLTKTKLVGVGTNGQENIEIGDNLILANGKLSATGGGSTLGRITITQLDESSLKGTYTGTIDSNTIKADFPFGTLTMIQSVEGYGTSLFAVNNGEINSLTIFDMYDGSVNGTNIDLITPDYLNRVLKDYQPKRYSHFITIDNTNNNNLTFYVNYQNTSKSPIHGCDGLKKAIVGKSLLCTGHSNTYNAEYISVDGENIVVGVVNKSDNSKSVITIDLTYYITDTVTPVE